MNITLIIVIAVAATIVLWSIGIFNTLKSRKIQIEEAWSSIDVQLKRKVNILTNLLDTLKMQMNFEKSVLTEITQARSGLLSSDKETAIAANDKLTKLLSSFNATIEAYPTLGTNQSFQTMMSDIRDCEDKVSYARTRYNMTVTKYNTEITIFPNCLVASVMGSSKEKMFEMTEPPRDIADNIRIGKL